MWPITYKEYFIGFTTSLVLTLISFGLVVSKVLEGRTLGYTLAALALTQAIIQVRYFLHLKDHAKPNWESAAFYFMVLVLLIIVLGTLWIMEDLNNRVMAGM